MKSILRSYVYGHWHISCCALALFIGGSALSERSINLEASIHIFFATLLIYNLHRLLGSERVKMAPTERYNYAGRHKAFAKCVIGFSLIVVLMTFFRLTTVMQVAIIISGILSIGYVLPLFLKRRLRDIGVVKIILISLVWSMIAILGILESHDWTVILVVFLEHFFFIFALTIPFDIRDQTLDNKAQVSNLANKIGLSNTRIILFATLLLSVFMSTIAFYWGVYSMAIYMSIVTLNIMIYLSTQNFKKEYSSLYYLLYLDGFILIKGLIYFL